MPITRTKNQCAHLNRHVAFWTRITQAAHNHRAQYAHRKRVQDLQLVVEFWANQLQQSTTEDARVLCQVNLEKAQTNLQNVQNTPF